MQIQISDGLSAWLEEMAAKAGKGTSEYANEALRQALEDREDCLEAAEALKEREANGGTTYSTEELRRALGLDSQVRAASAAAIEQT